VVRTGAGEFLGLEDDPRDRFDRHTGGSRGKARAALALDRCNRAALHHPTPPTTRASACRHRSWPARVPAFDGRCECRSSDRGRQRLECTGADGCNNSVDCRAINTKQDGEPVQRDRQYTAAKYQQRDYQHTIAKRQHVHCPVSKRLLVSRPLPALHRQQQQRPLRFWRVRVVA